MLLEQIYEGAPTVVSGRYRTTINELTDQRPALRPEILAEAVSTGGTLVALVEAVSRARNRAVGRA